MTQREKEYRIYQLYAGIDDCMRGIQSQATVLKNPEDTQKNLSIVMKIQDLISDIRRTYKELEQIELEEVEEEESQFPF